jgi:hypothetical protein
MCRAGWPALAALIVTSLLPDAGLARSSTPSGSGVMPRASVSTTVPLSFEANQGQAAPGIAFIAHAGRYTAFLSPSQATFELPVPSASRQKLDSPFPLPFGPATVHPATLPARLQFVGTNVHARFVGLDRLPGIVNYFIGRNEKAWRTDIPTYARVACLGIYPSIDLIYSARGQRLEYDWLLHPGARSDAIRWRMSGPGQLRLSTDGRLILSTHAGSLVEQAPVAYPQSGRVGDRAAVRVTALGHAIFGLRVRHYDPTRLLVVDPVVGFATYLGGSLGDSGKSITVDSEGNVYVTGLTASGDFPNKNGYPFHPVAGIGTPPHVFVTKLDPTGKGIVFSTYLGGSSYDEAFSVAQDSTGIYVAGSTESPDFPTVHAFQTKLGGGSDAFIAKLAPSGDSLIYSSYMGGAQNDLAYSVAIDDAHNAYMTGDTIPLHGGGANGTPPLVHAFVDKIAPDGSRLYNVLLAGDFQDTGYGIAADNAGDAYVVGLTQSTNFPSELTPAPGLIGSEDGYIAKLDPDGKLVYSTHLGGNDATVADAVTLDSTGNAYITGQTSSSDFPVIGGFQYRYGGNGRALTAGDAFVARVDRYGRLRYSTYLGGSRDDEGLGIAVDRHRDIFVTGWTTSADFPVKNALQPAMVDSQCSFGLPCEHAFAAEISADGTLAWSTYLGGSGSDQANGIALDSSDNVYLTGATSSLDFPTVQPLQSHTTDTGNLDRLDAFVVKLVPGSPAPNHSLVIDALKLFVQIHGRLNQTATVRLGQKITVIALFHDRRGAERRAFGTLSVTRNGHELVQRLMYRGTEGKSAALGSSFTLRGTGETGTMVAHVAVISHGVTALKTVRFRVNPR